MNDKDKDRLNMLADIVSILAEKVLRLEAKLNAQPKALDTFTEEDLDAHYEEWKAHQMEEANAAEAKCKPCGGYGWEMIWKTLTPRMEPCGECQR